MSFEFDRALGVPGFGVLANIWLLAGCAGSIAVVEVPFAVSVGTSATEANERLRVARNPDTAQSVLERLAGDQSEAVRIQVAANPNTPASALEQLAEDRSNDVRIAVSKNPGASAAIRAIALNQTYDGSISTGDGLPVVYTVKLIRFKPKTAILLSRALARLNGTKSFKTIAIRESDRVYLLETVDDPDRIEDRIYQVLEVEGVNSDSVRLEFADTTMLVENFGI